MNLRSLTLEKKNKITPKSQFEIILMMICTIFTDINFK